MLSQKQLVVILYETTEFQESDMWDLLRWSQMSVLLSTKSYFDINEICHVGRGR